MADAKSKRGKMLFLSLPLRILRWQLKLLDGERKRAKKPEAPERVSPPERPPPKQPRKP